MDQLPLPLEDIVLPATVDIWPLAVGWWLLLLLIIIAIAAFTILKIRRKKSAYRKESLDLLSQCYQHYQQSSDSKKSCQTMLTILKRSAITAYPNKNIDHLHGREWVDFLNQQIDTAIDEALSDVICHGQYQKNYTANIELIYKTCRYWVKNHKPIIQGGL